MNDTVTRLLALADDYATYAATAGIERYLKAKPNRNAELARQALEAELTRLFTPLSDEQIARMSSVAPVGSDYWVPWEYKREIERARAAGIRIAEEAHGIGGES